jgi:hypothetical protein
MCKIILTGEIEAIDLKSLHSSEIMQLDAHVTGITDRNGGYADIFIELRRGIFTLLKIIESYPLRHKNMPMT